MMSNIYNTQVTEIPLGKIDSIGQYDNSQQDFFFIEKKIMGKELSKFLSKNALELFQRLHYWINYNMKNKKQMFYHDGHWWTRNSAQEWRDRYFCHLSLRTVQRMIDELREVGLIVTENHNKNKYDRTLSYRIAFDRLHELCCKTFGKVEPPPEPDVSKKYPLECPINELKKDPFVIMESDNLSQSYIYNKEDINKRKKPILNLILGESILDLIFKNKQKKEEDMEKNEPINIIDAQWKPNPGLEERIKKYMNWTDDVFESCSKEFICYHMSKNTKRFNWDQYFVGWCERRPNNKNLIKKSSSNEFKKKTVSSDDEVCDIEKYINNLPKITEFDVKVFTEFAKQDMDGLKRSNIRNYRFSHIDNQILYFKPFIGIMVTHFEIRYYNTLLEIVQSFDSSITKIIFLK